MTLFTVFFQMLSLLLMIIMGAIATKTGILDPHTNTHISKLILNILNPMLVLSSAANNVGQIPLSLMGRIALVGVGMFAVFIFLATVLAPVFEKEDDQKKMFRMMFVFSNYGFIGIPVVSSVLGQEYVIYVTEFIVLYNLIFFTYGMVQMDGTFSASSLKTMVNPGNICSILAILVAVFSVRLPNFILTTIGSMGNATSPLAMLCVGYAVANTDLRQIFRNKKMYIFTVLKLLIIPLVLLFPLRLLVTDPMLMAVCMIIFGMPVGNMPLMLGTERGFDCTECSAAIILTTLLCVITVPILVAIII